MKLQDVIYLSIIECRLRLYINGYAFIFNFVHEGRYDLTEDIEYQVFIYLDLISLWKWK